EKVLAAYEAGCRRFDSTLTGLGGCPFTGDELVGNIATEIVVPALAKRGVRTDIDPRALGPVLELANEIPKQYAYASGITRDRASLAVPQRFRRVLHATPLS